MLGTTQISKPNKFPESIVPGQPDTACDGLGCTHDHPPPRLNKHSSHTLTTPSSTKSLDRIKITELDAALKYAKKETVARIDKISKVLAPEKNNVPSNRVDRINRLKKRLKDIEALPKFLEQNDLKFKGFSGWDKRNVIANNTKSNVSQFESVIAETKDSKEIIIPLESRYLKFKGQEIDFLEHQIKHEDHAHNVWEKFSLQKVLDQCIQSKIGEDEEGCPCCIAGLDFDEFAAALKEISRSNAETEGILSVPDFNSAEHWGVFLGVAAPLGLVGLAAAIRNIKGSIKTRAHIKEVIKGLSEDINNLQAQKKYEDVKKLNAFKKCLEYSKFDTEFNLVVPGFINGAASSLVLTTLLAKHPFALPVIALYATGQIARNTYDLSRVWNHKINPVAGDTLSVLDGKKKINNIAKEKRVFFASNAAGFAAFSAGAILTFISMPALGLFGSGAAILPIGLALLSVGAVSTGIMNNIWPRKFKPRNGDLGVSRMAINTAKQVIEEVNDRRQKKKIIQSASPLFKGDNKNKKRWIKFLTALPESKDFLPKKISARLSRFRKNRLPFLPATGSQASSKKHALNIKTIKSLHDRKEKSVLLQKTRIKVFEKLLEKKQVSSEGRIPKKWVQIALFTHSEIAIKLQFDIASEMGTTR